MMNASLPLGICPFESISDDLSIISRPPNFTPQSVTGECNKIIIIINKLAECRDI